ncbi:MAG TPA: hypothetical protein VHW72_02815 [Candidatus Angelobacter sp.]|nr:hypothetical protein [Candidatus Angelobacter sp.]
MPRDWLAEFDDLPETGRQALLDQRLRGQIDHLFLATEVIGSTHALGDFQENPHAALFAEFLQKDPEQKKALYALDQTKKKRLILWPRGCYKTSAVSVEIAQLILNYPNIRICFISGTKELAMLQLARIKGIFEKPSLKFRQLYPEFCAAPGKKLPDSGAKHFTVPCRTMNFPEPTICISSAKSVKASTHFDVLIADDMVNEQNYKNQKLLNAVWDDFCAIGPLVDPSGFTYVTGTRYAFGDIYERIIEQSQLDAKELGKTDWNVSRKSCWIKFCKTCGHPDLRHDSDRNFTQPPCTMCDCKCFVDSGEKQVIFPIAITKDGRQVGYTLDFLTFEQRKDPAFFANQYENLPVAKELQRYTPELIAQQTFYHLNVIPPAAGTFMVGDLSYIGDDKRDRSVLYLVKVWMGVLWVYHCIAGNWDSDEACTNILQAILWHRPQAVWIERFNGWEAYNNILVAKAAALNIQQLPVEWRKLDRRQNAKTIRIGVPLSWMKDRKLWLFAGMPWYDKLIKQLLKWPKIPHHDDEGDCLGHACEVPHGAAGIPAPGPQGTMGDKVRQMHRQAAENAGVPGFNPGGTGSGIVS